MSQRNIFEILERESESKDDILIAAELLLEREIALWRAGFHSVAGVDEVGRGPLAGPVVACACILPRGVAFHGIQDSKKLTAVERKKIADILTSHPDIHWAIGIVSSEKIDQINILKASLLAMQQAIGALPVRPDFILVDGRDTPTIELPQQAIIHGDALCQSIAAASIIAKVRRDEIMDEYHVRWPQYGFNTHKGYGTRAHLDAIQVYGLCPIHRRSFGPLKQDKDLELPLFS
jgi:ribonuclease HII